MKPFYVTVTNLEGARFWNSTEALPHNFRLYVDPVKGVVVGEQCLIKALGNYEQAHHVLRLMLTNETGQWPNIEWERK